MARARVRSPKLVLVWVLRDSVAKWIMLLWSGTENFLDMRPGNWVSGALLLLHYAKTIMGEQTCDENIKFNNGWVLWN